MTDNIRPALYEAKYDMSIVNKLHEPADEKVTIAGKCCESGDILMKDIYIQKPERGDILAVFTTGAYGFSMFSNYNKNVRPAVVFFGNGQEKIVSKRQDYKDLLGLEI